MGPIQHLFRCRPARYTSCDFRCVVGLRKTQRYADDLVMLIPCAPLDYETRLYKGCSASELFSIALAVGCGWLPLALIIGFVALDGLHALFIGFAVFVGGLLILVATIATVLMKIKQGKPEGWHLRRLYCQVHPLLNNDLVYKSGHWSTIREH